MFTSIQKLRASSAMQDRVTTVENYLKKTYGNGQWDTRILFPAAIVLISNTRADFEWVMVNAQELKEVSYNGVNAEDYAQPENFSTKADAEKYVQDCRDQATAHSNPFLQNPVAKDVSENKDWPFPEARASLISHKAKVQTARTLARRAPTVKAPRQLPSEQVTIPMIKNFAAKVRVRKDMETLLTALGASKLVTTVTDVNSNIVKSQLGITVPKGKQAYIVVF